MSRSRHFPDWATSGRYNACSPSAAGIGRMCDSITRDLEERLHAGFDVGREMVRWCAAHISARLAPGLEFSWAARLQRQVQPLRQPRGEPSSAARHRRLGFDFASRPTLALSPTWARGPALPRGPRWCAPTDPLWVPSPDRGGGRSGGCAATLRLAAWARTAHDAALPDLDANAASPHRPRRPDRDRAWELRHNLELSTTASTSPSPRRLDVPLVTLDRRLATAVSDAPRCAVLTAAEPLATARRR